MMLDWIAFILVAPSMGMLTAECLAAFRSGRNDRAPLPEAPPFAIVMPAHNEAGGIAESIAAAMAQLRPCDRLIVIADNCDDATAAIARHAGAAVAVRTCLHHRGKGFALDFGRDALRHDPPAIVVVLDADCQPAPGALLRLSAAAGRHRAAVQGLYLMAAAAPAGTVIAFSLFAFMVRNRVRQRGLQRLCGQALLQGTGMAMPWPIFRDAPLASADLVEDLQLGLDLFLDGRTVRFEEQAVFTSPAASRSATVAQRTRWEHGRLALAMRYVPRLLRAAAGGRWPAALLALDLAVPPLSLLILLALAALLFTGLTGAWAGDFVPLLLLAGLVLLMCGSLLLVWHRWGQALLPRHLLPALPAYLLWKLPIYVRFLFRREREWLRTGREP